MLVARLRIEAEGGDVAGYSGELLVPKWFSKDPESSIEDDRRDLIAAARKAFDVAKAASGEGAGATAFDVWMAMQAHCVEADAVPRSMRLVASFGVALVERAMLDAVCRATDASFFKAATNDSFGLRFGRLDPRLDGWSPRDLGDRTTSVRLRHTVGLVDALDAHEVPADAHQGDDHPLCLVEDVAHYGLDCFKLKVSGNAAADAERLARIDELTPGGATFTLDGNEQYDDPAVFADALDDLDASGAAPNILRGLLAIEQPVHRARTFDPATEAGVRRLAERAPVIIDEADADLGAYGDARALGYGGTSMKACKGVLRALFTRARMQADGEGFQSAEDLTNLPALPLHQDLAVVSLLGLPHVERNGHHYFRGQEHLTEPERTHLSTSHADLYTDGGRLRIESGRLSLTSLETRAFGYAGPVDLEAGQPVEPPSA